MTRLEELFRRIRFRLKINFKEYFIVNSRIRKNNNVNIVHPIGTIHYNYTIIIGNLSQLHFIIPCTRRQQ